ncbi:hypothetical protein HDU81_010992, partial [Chytriomyces hyalinus]
MSQQFTPPSDIKDYLEAPASSLEFPPLLKEILEALMLKCGVVANGLGLHDLKGSCTSYSVQYFDGENMGGYFVSTLSGDKVVLATFLFPAMVYNNSNLTFTHPCPDSNFFVAGMYCQVLCDMATAVGLQKFLESDTVLKDGQTIYGKCFEFEGIPINGSVEQQLFTRFSHTYVAPAQGPSTP